MEYSKNWLIIRELDEGGQGKVFIVQKKTELNSYSKIRAALHEIINKNYSIIQNKEQSEAYNKLRDCIIAMIYHEDFCQLGALKVLHDIREARDPKNTKERMKSEIEIMSKNIHPNLIKMLETDIDSQWYISKYYSNGNLASNKHLFKGNLLGALKAIRPLVEAVASLHKQGYVHRDIKPHNIFLDKNNSLILGDFGLIYFEDNQHKRVSDTYDNVGSRDWMPGWAMGMRIDKVNATFDVFGLGKLLWSMVSGKEIMQLWYYNDSKFNLEELFPNSDNMRFANRLFSKCIVEKENDCLKNATDLLEEIDKTISLVERHADPIGKNIKRRCKVCGEGIYNLVVNDHTQAMNYGIISAGNRNWKIYECSNCGNVQWFSYNTNVPKVWSE
jgi:serine/threonine protein kinase